MEELDKASEIELGFPHDFLNSANVQEIMFSGRQADILKP